jgi:myo-inositol-1(or 4)-monophosphatase
VVQDITFDAAALLAHIEAAAIEAARFIRAREAHRSAIEWRAKSLTDFVSDVDTGAERIIRHALTHDHAGAHIVGEELSPDTAADSEISFIVDPLDGTTNFLHGFAEYAVSIAAAVRGAVVAAVIIAIPTNEHFTAMLGGGAFRNGEPISVSSIDEPSRALIGTGFPFGAGAPLDLYLRHFAAVAPHTAGMRRPGSAALDLVHVACGQFDAFWELTLKPWDFAAGMLLVREAGGVVTTVSGGDVPLSNSSLLAGNPAMHGWLARTLAAATPAGSIL